MKIAVISPHRDDAAFSCTLTLANLVQAGHFVDVINCFTCSEYAPHAEFEGAEGDARVRYISALRLGEDHAWMAMFGGQVRRVDLNLRDAPLRLGAAIDAVCSIPVDDRDETPTQIQRALERVAPDALLLPLGIGSHVDHLTARNAAIESLPQGIPCAFYEDLPYAARPGAEGQIHWLAASLGLDLKPGFCCVRQSGDDAEGKKLAAARCYPSQVSEDVMLEIARFCCRYGGRERLWVDAGWRVSGPRTEDGRAGANSH